MYATLKEEVAPVKLRAVAPLNEGTRVGILAYIENDDPEPGESLWVNAGYAQYLVISPPYNTPPDGVLTPASHPLRVVEDDYKFVAYSLNKDTLLTDPEEITDPIIDRDLMWGFTTKTITDLDSSVHITMNHMFSLVTLEAVTLFGNSSVIMNISAALNTFKPTLTFEDGNLSTTFPMDTVHFKWPYSGSAQIWTSDSLYVYTNGATGNASVPTTLIVNSVTIDGKTYTNNNAGFNINYNKIMRAGRSYKLYIEFKPK
jgi:hypothetical protein